MKSFFKVFFVFIVINPAWGQYQEIPLVNPSFEGTPAAGTNFRSFLLSGWYDCAPYYFEGQTPPDVQPGTMEFFDVTTLPYEGNTYLGMVTRQNETWELVSQRLIIPIEKDNCYSFDVYLARSDKYFSQLLNQRDTTKRFNFNKPIVLRIWGGRNVYEKRELLDESPVIEHTDWRQYSFEFKAKQDHDYLIFEAFYKTPTLLPYNGNILLDAASQIRQIICPGEEENMLAENTISRDTQPENRTVTPEVNKPSSPSTKPGKTTKGSTGAAQKKDPDSNAVAAPRILKQLDKTTIKEGQTIRIDQLYFLADSSNFTSNSVEVLDEIYEFLIRNPLVVIEIGGHTNGIPGMQYCQELSLRRAKAVADYLYQRGIPHERIIYKGYGKEKPIASNKTHLGRQKNQRVEIKILKND